MDPATYLMWTVSAARFQGRAGHRGVAEEYARGPTEVVRVVVRPPAGEKV